MKALLPLFVALALCSGCATSISARKAPSVDLRTYKHIFVEQPLNENHHVDELIAEELRALGFDATSGPLTMMPENVDAVVSYHARWTGDFIIYLIDLNVMVYTRHTHKTLAEGRYYQPTVRTKSGEQVVHILIPRMFAK
jgi:hypothetical protein